MQDHIVCTPKACCASSGRGFGTGLTAHQIAELRRMGEDWNSDISGHRKAVIELFSPLVAKGPKNGTRVLREIRYGPHSRHLLDIFAPADARARPTILFIHGGAFTRGSKSVNGEIYDNVLFWFAQRGFIGVNVEYRLAPDSPFPAGPQDVAAAIDWATGNIAQYGGDRNRLITIGHSAGGCHLASYLLDPALDIDPSPAIRAAVLISARLRLDLRADNPNAENVAACFGKGADTLAARSPLVYAHRCRWPVMIAFAQFENRHLDSYGLEFAQRLSESKGKAPRVIQCPGHNHTSIVAHFNSGDDDLGNAILAFLVQDCGIAPGHPVSR
jgi:acetyl esterase